MIFDPVGYEIMKIKLYIILFFQGVYGEGAKGLNHVELVHRVLWPFLDWIAKNSIESIFLSMQVLKGQNLEKEVNFNPALIS